MITTATRHDWQAPDGETFPYSLWGGLPEGQSPAAIVVAVHGLSGAALNYEPLGSHLVQHGVVTLALELRGQGNDPDLTRRGDLEKLEHWFIDLSAFFALARSQYPGVPVFYYGESMGAALLTRFLAQAPEHDQPDGVVLASPVIAAKNRPGWWFMQFFRFLQWWRPTYRLDLKKIVERDGDNPSKWVTRDEAHRIWFRTAPHKLDSFTVRFFKNLGELIDGCFAVAPKIRVPVLVLYCANDIFVAPVMVEKFFERLGSRDKEIHFFSEAFHLLLFDDDTAQVLACVEAWLLPRIALPAV